MQAWSLTWCYNSFKKIGHVFQHVFTCFLSIVLLASIQNKMFIGIYNRLRMSRIAKLFLGNRIRREVLNMLSELSSKEMEVINLLVYGYTNSQISKRLFIAVSTVKAHVQAILYKLNVNYRVQAAIIAANYLGITSEDIVKIANRKSI